MARHQYQIQMMTMSFVFCINRAAFLLHLSAAHKLEQTQHAQLRLFSTILVCGELTLDSFSASVLVTRADGSVHEKPALLDADRLLHQFSASCSSAGSTRTVCDAFAQDIRVFKMGMAAVI